MNFKPVRPFLLWSRTPINVVYERVLAKVVEVNLPYGFIFENVYAFYYRKMDDKYIVHMQALEIRNREKCLEIMAIMENDPDFICWTISDEGKKLINEMFDISELNNSGLPALMNAGVI